MKNFIRVVRLTLRHRLTFAAAIACSLGVAVLWGANLGLIKPVIEIVFSEKQPHAWADSKVAESQQAVASARNELTQAAAEAAQAPVGKSPNLALKQATLKQRLAIQEKALRATEFARTLVHKCLPNSKFLTLGLFLAFLVFATLVKDVMLVGQTMLVERLVQLGTLEVRDDLFRKTVDMDLAQLGNSHSGQIMQRIKGDLTCTFAGVNALLGRMILEPLKMAACLIGAAVICWRLLAVSLLVAPIAVWVIVQIMRSVRRANKRAMDEMGHLYTLLGETLTNLQTVKAFGMEDFERHRYHQSGRNFYYKSLKITFYNALGRTSSEFMGIAIICLAIFVGGYLVINQQTTLLGISIMDAPLSVGSIMAFYALLAGTSDPSRKISEVTGLLQRGIVAADRLYEILDAQPAIVDPPQPISLVNSQPELVFDRVSFQYSTGQRALHEIELRIPFGQTVAIVGPNGCGKTTLANLLPRFYDPTEGAVRLDGIDLREMRLKDLRRMAGYVAQQAMLFDDTVLNNIRYGSPEASDEAVIAAAEKAFAHRFIVEKLEKKYETTVGERGGRLSGGQRQRILLARAILRDPKFLILDEATSQVDLESEQLIHRVLEQFVRGRTTLLITHRMSSIALADRVVVMDNGRIVDSGQHEELIGRCELYARLQQLGLQHAA